MLSNYAKIRQIQKLNEEELKYKINQTGSWHEKVRIYINSIV